MTLGRFSLAATALLALSVVATAGPVTLDTQSYNFPLDNGGGGASATLNKTQNIEIFCVDYANDIYVPVQGYSANLSTITSGSDLSETRFGGQTSWADLTGLSGGLGNPFTGSDANTLDNITSALARYQMAAYLVSTYNLKSNPTNSPANDGIQQAIWDILDPNTFAVFSGATTDNALAGAVNWYSSNSSSNRDSFLANYRIVSDATMGGCTGSHLVHCGFQEQITAVPEPRFLAVMLVGLLLIGAAFRKMQAARRANC